MKKIKFIKLFLIVAGVITFVWLLKSQRFISYRKKYADDKRVNDKQIIAVYESDEENIDDDEIYIRYYDEEDVKEEKNSIGNSRYEQQPIINSVHDKEYYYDFSNEKLAWWFKRDNAHGPSGCDDKVNLSDYGAYYLDDKATDDEKVIYLTFDCGYENGYTGHILDVLAEEDVPACFFVTKTYIRDNIDLTKRMKEEGHQVGNHTITHPSLPTKSYEEIKQEICGCSDYMKEATGYDMDPYLRPPCGEYSERTLAITHDLGFKTIFWSMAYMDYDVDNQPGVDYVINHFNKYHHSGAIILMHNVSASNSEALQTVIKNLKACGYRFASLNELE